MGLRRERCGLVCPGAACDDANGATVKKDQDFLQRFRGGIWAVVGVVLVVVIAIMIA